MKICINCEWKHVFIHIYMQFFMSFKNVNESTFSVTFLCKFSCICNFAIFCSDFTKFSRNVELRNWEWYTLIWEFFAPFWIGKGPGRKSGLGKSLHTCDFIRLNMVVNGSPIPNKSTCNLINWYSKRAIKIVLGCLVRFKSLNFK